MQHKTKKKFIKAELPYSVLFINEDEEAQEYLDVLTEDDVEDYELTRFVSEDDEE